MTTTEMRFDASKASEEGLSCLLAVLHAAKLSGHHVDSADEQMAKKGIFNVIAIYPHLKKEILSRFERVVVHTQDPIKKAAVVEMIETTPTRPLTDCDMSRGCNTPCTSCGRT